MGNCKVLVDKFTFYMYYLSISRLMVSKALVSTQIKDQKNINLLIHCCIKWDGTSHGKLGFKRPSI